MKAEALYRSDPGLPLDALAWLWPIVSDPAIDGEIARTIANRAHDTPGAATFSSGYDDGAYLVLASDRRTDGIVLDALITKQPTSDLIPKVVAGLIGNQVKGRWNNVQENGFILVALQRYFAAYEAQSPAFVARIWLGDDYAAEHSFQGRSIDREHTLVPMSALKGNPDIVLEKAGSGRLYYRLGLRIRAGRPCAPRATKASWSTACTKRSTIRTTYDATVTGSGTSRPARWCGFGWRWWPMPITPTWRSSTRSRPDSNHSIRRSPRHRGHRPNTARMIRRRRSSPLGTARRGSITRICVTTASKRSARTSTEGPTTTPTSRATTIGSFVVPPAKAEEIYAPEVFGRTASDRVVIG